MFVGSNQSNGTAMQSVLYLQSAPENYKFAEVLKKAFSASGMRYHIAYTRDGVFFMVEPKDMLEALNLVSDTPRP